MWALSSDNQDMNKKGTCPKINRELDKASYAVGIMRKALGHHDCMRNRTKLVRGVSSSVSLRRSSIHTEKRVFFRKYQYFSSARQVCRLM